jgi:hypothetical protein
LLNAIPTARSLSCIWIWGLSLLFSQNVRSS